MLQKKYKLTTAKINELKTELAFLMTKGRKEILERLEDIQRETTEELEDPYTEISEDRLYLEKRIKEIKEILAHVEEVSGERKKDGHVMIGSKVRVGIESFENVYTLVDPLEADPLDGKISTDSPVGKALLGTHVGDIVTVIINNSKSSLRVLHID